MHFPKIPSGGQYTSKMASINLLSSREYFFWSLPPLTLPFSWTNKLQSHETFFFHWGWCPLHPRKAAEYMYIYIYIFNGTIYYHDMSFYFKIACSFHFISVHFLIRYRIAKHLWTPEPQKVKVWSLLRPPRYGVWMLITYKKEGCRFPWVILVINWLLK